MQSSLLLKKTHFIWKNTVKINTMTTRTTNGCGYTSHVVTVDLVPARANPPGGANMLSIASAFNTRTTNIDIPHPAQRRLATSNSIRRIEVTEPQGSSTELDEVFIAKEARSEHI